MLLIWFKKNCIYETDWYYLRKRIKICKIYRTLRSIIVPKKCEAKSVQNRLIHSSTPHHMYDCLRVFFYARALSLTVLIKAFVWLPDCHYLIPVETHSPLSFITCLLHSFRLFGRRTDFSCWFIQILLITSKNSVIKVSLTDFVFQVESYYCLFCIVSFRI